MMNCYRRKERSSTCLNAAAAAQREEGRTQVTSCQVALSRWFFPSQNNFNFHPLWLLPLIPPLFVSFVAVLLPTLALTDSTRITHLYILHTAYYMIAVALSSTSSKTRRCSQSLICNTINPSPRVHKTITNQCHPAEESVPCDPRSTLLQSSFCKPLPPPSVPSPRLCCLCVVSSRQIRKH